MSKKITMTFLLEAIGEKDVAAAIRRLAGTSTEAGKSVSEAGKSGAVELAKAEGAASKLDKSLEKVGGSQALKEASDDAKKLADNADEASSRFDKAREWASNIGQTAGVWLDIARNLSQVSAEGDNVVARFEAIFTAQKRMKDLPAAEDAIAEVTQKAHLPDDDPVYEAATQMASDQVASEHMRDLLEATVRNANAVGGSIEEVGTAFAKAYAEGSLTRLQRANILFTDQEKEALAAAYAISDLAGRAKFMEVVMASTERSTAKLGEGLTDTQKAANDAARGMDDFQTSAGRGVRRAEAALDGVNEKLLGIIARSPEAAESMGNAFFWVSSATIGVTGIAGGILSIIANAAQAGPIISQFFSWIAGTPAWISLVANSQAAWAAVSAQAAAAWASIVASATAGTIGLNLFTAGLFAIGVVAGVAADAVIFSIGKSIGWIDKEESYVDRLSAAWTRLKAIVTGATPEWEQNETDLAAEIAKVKGANSAAVLKGTKTQDEADKDNIKQELALREKFAREQLRVGDTANMTRNQEAAARLKEQQELKAKTTVPVPIPSSFLPTGGAGATDANSPYAMAGMMPASVTSGLPAAIAGVYVAPEMGPGSRVEEAERKVKAIEAQIDALQDAKYSATERKKPVIEAQLREKKKQLDAAKEQLKADEKETKTNQKTAGYALDVQKVRDSILINGQIAGLEDALEIAKEEADAEKVRALTLQIKALEAQKAYASALSDAAQAQLTDPSKAESMRDIAKLNYDDSMRQSTRAANKAVKQLESGGKKKKLSPAEIASIFGATGGTSVSMGFPSLGSDIDYGGRFADAAASMWDGEVGGGYRQGIAGIGDFGGQGQQRREMDKQRKIRTKSMSQKSNGNYVVKFEIEDLEIPYMGIGALEGW